MANGEPLLSILWLWRVDTMANMEAYKVEKFESFPEKLTMTMKIKPVSISLALRESISYYRSKVSIVQLESTGEAAVIV